ncbi:hypothetical protein LUZ61_001735 [Rhynchospora tenuis]|uniref:Cytochrome P450 n=1 Tax=Rhynchospora tenuis TaxID=198213 RepID=A0AAD5ZHL4_9POAL|nr:hypothetical protein LUZ61_001735 [Rhynchospora tenuis]
MLTFAFVLATFLSLLKAVKAFPAAKPSILRLPPGPWQLPVIGSIHHLIIAGSLPYRALHDMSRKYGPLMLLKIGETPTVIASSVEAATEILKTQDITFSSRPISVTTNIMSSGGRDMFSAPYSDYWKQIRKVCIMRLFGPKRIQAFKSIQEEEAKNLIRSVTTTIEASSPVNLSELITFYFSNITARAITGTTHKEQLEFLRVWEKIKRLASGDNLVDLFPSKRWFTIMVSGATYEAERCHRIVGELLDNLIMMKRERSTISDATDTEDEDLLDMLLKMDMGEGSELTPLKLDSIKVIIMNLFGGGSETSVPTIEWAMLELLRHPSALERAQAEVRSALKGKTTVTMDDVNELSFIRNVIRETLRLHLPVPLLPRVSKADCTVLGYDIPKNTKVLVNAWALARDPKYWEDADAFKPERFEVQAIDYKGTELEYMPFSAGCRQCPGRSLGLANVELCLANLLYHFDWKFPPGVKPNKLDMSESFAVTIRRKHQVYLCPVLHVPSAA